MDTGKITITKGYKGVDDTNPLMTQRFGADPYAMVYRDRVYIYMTADVFEYNTDGMSRKIHTVRFTRLT